MSESEKTVIATHNMKNNAGGLADFIINQGIDNFPKIKTIYMMDEEGNHVKQARLVEVTLGDGSKVYNLVLTLDS